jgi:hypothetical protein
VRDICILDPDGDIVQHLIATDAPTVIQLRASLPHRPRLPSDTIPCRIVGAKQLALRLLSSSPKELFASGCQFLISGHRLVEFDPSSTTVLHRDRSHAA